MMVFHTPFRRLLGKRRIFVAFVTVIIASIVYVCYQAFSIRKLGEELSAEYKRKASHSNFHSYEKADFPVHLLPSNGERDASGARVAHRDDGIRIRGVLVEEVHQYIPNSRGNFRCTGSKEEIAYHRVNDNYCDCKDGTDEPSTSACQDGRFYCDRQPPSPAKKVHIVSSRVNDGICDCCDGSDEWAEMTVPEHVHIDEKLQKKLKIDLVPCDDRCQTFQTIVERGL